jgi:hypothetical protein
MTILKLPDVGDSATLKIVECQVVEGVYGEQIKFVDSEGQTLFLPRNSADRQLARIGFDANTDNSGELDIDYPAVPGHTLTFSRSPNPKRGAAPFWDIERAGKGNGKPPVSAKNEKTSHTMGGKLPNDPPEDATEVEPSELDRLLSLHARLYKHVLAHYVPAALEAGIEVDLSGVSALTAQLFIPGSKL